MTEKDILKLIKKDVWMMSVIKVASEQNLNDWLIGAGFVRNKVWDELHGIESKDRGLSDVDLVYFDPKGNNEKEDELLSEKLSVDSNIKWEVVNQYYAGVWNNLPAYKSTEDAISQWPETATAIGVTLKNGELELIAPHGIGDLLNLIVKPTPAFINRVERVKERAAKKRWYEKWPRLRFEEK